MIPVHTFVGGREAEYRLKYWGHKLRFELAGIARQRNGVIARRSIVPSPAKLALRRDCHNKKCRPPSAGAELNFKRAAGCCARLAKMGDAGLEPATPSVSSWCDIAA